MRYYIMSWKVTSEIKPHKTLTELKIIAFWDVGVYYVSDVCTASIIALMIEAVRASEMLVYSNETTRRYIPQDSNLHTRRR
jgi:hypothetical protein